MTRLARSASPSGLMPFSPRAMASAFVNVLMPSTLIKTCRDAVLLPAPLIPANTATRGGLLSAMSRPPW